MTCLVSSHGTIVCRAKANGRLVHRPLTAALDDVDVLDIGALDAILQVGIATMLRDDADALRLVVESGPLSGWMLKRSPDHRSLLVTRDDQYLTARAGTEPMELSPNNSGEDAWFLPFSASDVEVLCGILAAKWLVRSAGAAIQPEPAVLAARFVLRIGSADIDLRWNLPFDRAEFPYRLTLLRDGWRIERIYRYRPLVYFVAFGDPTVMRQFALSLTSLLTAGGYDGETVVITDKTPAEISTLLPKDLARGPAVLPAQAHDRVGYQGARLMTAAWAGAWDFQPLLYVDCDLLFDLPVAPMLYAIAQSDLICAPVEASEFIASSVFVGSTLIQQDKDAPVPPPNRRGFNGGTLGIPNMARHGHTLDLIGRVLFNHGTMSGRNSIPYLDQGAANYVSYRLADIDIERISPYVRLSDHSADPSDRKGIVHYCWVPGGELRVSVMRDYLQRLAEL